MVLIIVLATRVLVAIFHAAVTVSVCSTCYTVWLAFSLPLLPPHAPRLPPAFLAVYQEIA